MSNVQLTEEPFEQSKYAYRNRAQRCKYTILFFNVLFNITFGIIIKSGRESVMFFEE